jgi:protein-L-isoaspartate(D-aspartate) O-methyltransferase
VVSALARDAGSQVTGVVDVFEMKSVQDARRAYAERLRRSGPVGSEGVITAFATVPRERFVGDGPWTIIPPGRAARRTPDSDPCRLYDNVLVSLDENRNINNGEPRLWAVLFDLLEIGAGASVAHVGSGTGYYSAILAELVGPSGKVTAIEVDPDFALQTWENLAPWPQAKTVAGNGLTDVPPDVDFIVVSAGLTFLPVAWLDALREGGKLLLPLTVTHGWTDASEHAGRCVGRFLVVERQAGQWPARFATPVAIIDCSQGRDPDSEERLRSAFLGGDSDQVRSLRRFPDLPDDSCWLEGEGWWLSTGEGKVKGDW